MQDTDNRLIPHDRKICHFCQQPSALQLVLRRDFWAQQFGWFEETPSYRSIPPYTGVYICDFGHLGFHVWGDEISDELHRKNKHTGNMQPPEFQALMRSKCGEGLRQRAREARCLALPAFAGVELRLKDRKEIT